jgi:hypothetical protein
MKIQAIQDTIGSLPNLPNAATVKKGDVYEVFALSNDKVILVGLGHIVFDLCDFEIIT